MLRLATLAAGATMLFALFSCAKEPAIEYRLTPEQLAWQGYKMGEVLRFGNARPGQERTYQVVHIKDTLETQFMGTVVALPFPRKADPLYQQIKVRIERTDTVNYGYYALELSRNYDPVNVNQTDFRAQAEWAGFYPIRLPLDEVIAGQPIDTLYYPATTLLPAIVLGATNYQQVIRIINLDTRTSNPGHKRTRAVYYARGKGVVAFEEDGTGLWYRLP